MAGDEYMDWASVSSLNDSSQKKKKKKIVLMNSIAITLCNHW